MREYEYGEGRVRNMWRSALFAIVLLCLASITVLADPADARDDGDATYREEGIIEIHLDTALAQSVKYGLRVYEGRVADITDESTPIKDIEKVMITHYGKTEKDFSTPKRAMSELKDMDAGLYALELYDEEKKVGSRWIDMTVYGVKILGTEFYVQKDGKVEIEAEVYYETACTLDWSSSDESVATVSGSGLKIEVNGLEYGEVTITATIHEDTQYKDTCTVIVYKQATDILLDPESATLYYDDPARNTVTIQATPVPQDDPAVKVLLEWSSDNESVATVDENGVVTGLSRGTATITVTDKLSGISKECKITVRNTPSPPGPTPPGPTPPGPTPPGPIAPTDVEIEPEEVTLKVDETFTLTAILLPEGSVWPLEWSSSDPSIVSVAEDGTITAHAIGDATVTVRAGLLWATCLVHVVPVPITVKVEADDMEVGGYQKARVIVEPPGSEIEPISWSSSDESVATVDSAGMIHAVGVGEVTITVTMSDGQTASVTIKVLPVPEPEPGDHSGNWCTWFWIIILIVIIIELVLAVRFKRRYDELEDEVNAS